MIYLWKFNSFAVLILMSAFLFYFDSKAIASWEPTETIIMTQWNKQKNEIIIAFETKNYAVKIYLQQERLLMDVYNKKTANLMLDRAPVRVTRSSNGTGYWYKNKFTFRVFERIDGRKWLTINQYGQAMDEIWERELKADGF